MYRNRFILVSLVFLAALLQFSVFSAWPVGGAAPQIWLAVAFFLYLSGRLSQLPIFTLLYFSFFGLLESPRPALLTSLVYIAGAEIFRRLGQRFFSGRFLPPLLFFLGLNLLVSVFPSGSALWRRGFSLLPALLLVNLVFFISFYPILSLLQRAFFKESLKQLSLNIK